MWLQELVCYPARAGFPELPPGPWLKDQKRDVVEILDPKRHDLLSYTTWRPARASQAAENKTPNKPADRLRAR